MTRFALLELTYWLVTIIANQLVFELVFPKPTSSHQTVVFFAAGQYNRQAQTQPEAVSAGIKS